MPSRPRWKHVAKGLLAFAGAPTTEQRELAKFLQLRLPRRVPMPVAAALLRTRLRQPLLLDRTDYPTEGQLGYVQGLAQETGRALTTELKDRSVLDAWVHVLHAVRAAQHLQRLRPEVGDIVQTAGDPRYLGEISSISDDGRLNFRGSPGARARPHLVEIIARSTASDDVAAQARYRAKQIAAARRTDAGRFVGTEQLRSLRDRYVIGAPSAAAVGALGDALDHSRDERPLQRMLEQHPQLLTYLVASHHGGYVFPQVHLGAHWVADFFVAGLTSLGLRWTMVELESPAVSMTLQDGEPSKELRHALKQIADWREWLQENLDQARKPRGQQGLGLYGIRPQARGLIIIGRGAPTTETNAMRSKLWESARVDVRSYDWLLREAATRRMVQGALDLDESDDDPF